MSGPQRFEPLHDPTKHDVDDPEARWFFVRGNEVVVADDDGAVIVPTGDMVVAQRAAAGKAQVLGRQLPTGATYWTAPLPDDYEPPAGFFLSGLRGLFTKLPESEWNIGGRATQITDWVRDNTYCGRCAGPMNQADSERSMRCPDDGFLAYPRLSPAVIMLITNDDGRALLGRSGMWDMPMYSTLAGFVEPGETLEETVHREVREEVGIEVRNVTYFASQAWPFPNSLMLGFTAKWASGDIEIDGVEIVDAQWFTREDLPMIPPSQSIARQLIDSWLIA